MKTKGRCSRGVRGRGPDHCFEIAVVSLHDGGGDEDGRPLLATERHPHISADWQVTAVSVYEAKAAACTSVRYLF